MSSVPSQSSSDLYLHIRVVISIIVGLCITTLLSGFARFVQHPKRARASLLHLGWAASLLLWIIHFWWWEFRLSLVRQWTFAMYFFVILYAILYYFLCTLLFPSDFERLLGIRGLFSFAAQVVLWVSSSYVHRGCDRYGFEGQRLSSLVWDGVSDTHRSQPGVLLDRVFHEESQGAVWRTNNLFALSCLLYSLGVRDPMTGCAIPGRT